MADSTDLIYEFLDKPGLSALSKALLTKVNARIEERIVQTVDELSDATHVPSAIAVYNAISNMSHIKFKTVTGAIEDVTDPNSSYIYLQRDNEADTMWMMYVYDAELGWINIGDTEVNLSNYWSKDPTDIEALKLALGLTDLAFSTINTDQFELDENKVLNIKNVDSNLITYKNNTLDESIAALYETRKYEVTNGIFDDTLISYSTDEIRVKYTANSPFTQLESNGGDTSTFYMGVRAYAPDGAVSFKEDLKSTIEDPTMFYFEGNDFAGIDKYGRKYSIIWLAVAALQEDGTWIYYGENSTANKYVGWFYSVEWYNADGKVIAADTIRINLADDEGYTSNIPYYVTTEISKITTTLNDEYVKKSQLVKITEEEIAAAVDEAYTASTPTL